MDLTSLFKASVKTARTRNKFVGEASDKNKNALLGIGLKNKCKKITHTTFAQKATEIVKSINKLKDFLMQHRKDYINLNFVMYEASNMTDAERDQIDRDAEQFMQTCKEVIKNLSQDSKIEQGPQFIQHREAVLETLEVYLKSVCNIYSELKANRVKRTVDKQKLLRLESGYRASKAMKKVDQNDKAQTKIIRSNETLSEMNNNNAEKEKLLVPQTTSNETKPTLQKQSSLDEKNDSSMPSISFSAEETQLFEQENHQLWEALNSMVDEVKQIEGKVVEISRLQDIFSERVLEQETQINHISDVTVGATENIKEGNEELRQAMRKNAGFRLWILFILVVLSFTILFLNWYNP